MEELAMGPLENEMTATQRRFIREHLEKFGSIDKFTALELYDCDALRSRISELRHDAADPMPIKTVFKSKKNKYGHTTTYGTYHLIREGEST
jgi:hypothetical protein